MSEGPDLDRLRRCVMSLQEAQAAASYIERLETAARELVIAIDTYISGVDGADKGWRRVLRKQARLKALLSYPEEGE